MTLLDTLFVIFIAGCSHDGAQCGPLHAEELRAPDLSTCEAILDARLLAQVEGWPVTFGSCEVADTPNFDDPTWYPARDKAAQLS